jgi:TPR repeat protein
MTGSNTPTADLLFFKGDAAQDAGDFATARQAFERGAALDDPICWVRLGLMFHDGIGCDADKRKAMQCYRKAWRARDQVAANNIAILYREAGNRRAMFRWFERGAAVGDGDALVELAKCFINGIGVRRNLSIALRYINQAIRSENITEAGREEAEELLAGLRPRSIESM